MRTLLSERIGWNTPRLWLKAVHSPMLCSAFIGRDDLLNGAPK